MARARAEAGSPRACGSDAGAPDPSAPRRRRARARTPDRGICERPAGSRRRAVRPRTPPRRRLDAHLAVSDDAVQRPSCHQVRQVGAEREVPTPWRGRSRRAPAASADRHLYMANASAWKSVSFANGTSRSRSQRARFPVAKTLSAAERGAEIRVAVARVDHLDAGREIAPLARLAAGRAGLGDPEADRASRPAAPRRCWRGARRHPGAPRAPRPARSALWKPLETISGR